MKEWDVGLRIWLETKEGFSFGPGQAELLKNIKVRLSLRKAAEHMGMSYRRAWGRLKKMEATLGSPLVYKAGGNKSGFRLTEFAEHLVQDYEAWVEEVETYAKDTAKRLLPVANGGRR